MKFKLPQISWFNKKPVNVFDGKIRFKLKATFSETINFLVKYPSTDKQFLIKEFTQKDWVQEIELINPVNLYFEIFLTNNNHLSKAIIKLEIILLSNSEITESKEEEFKIGKNLNNNEWLKINLEFKTS
jgi:hypothetical protein